MIYKFVSVYEIIEGVYRDTAIHEELDIWDEIEGGGEALELIGAGLAYEELIAEVCVKEHRGALPCNLHILDSISYKGDPLKQCTGTFGAISTTPTKTEVRKAFREKSFANHPDKKSEGERDKYQEIYKNIGIAYKLILSRYNLR